MTLTWKGDAIVAAVERDAAAATVETVDDAVLEARGHTPVETGLARDSLTRENDGLAVRWGYHVSYGIWIEVGARGKAGIHALRRAADHQYAKLAGRIRRRRAV
jgi:hypothetical protein